MSFNCPEFIKDFSDYVKGLGTDSAIEVGCLSGELKDALVYCDGIDIDPKRDDVIKADILDFKPNSKFDIVFSSGLLEHCGMEMIIEIIKAMSACSRKYVLNYVPNTNCLAYRKAKGRTKAKWKDESDFTEESLAKIHEEAGLEVIETGTAGGEWAKRFGKEPSDPYLVYCLAMTKKRTKEKQNRI